MLRLELFNQVEAKMFEWYKKLIGKKSSNPVENLLELFDSPNGGNVDKICDEVLKFLESGDDINVAGKDGETLLIKSIKSGFNKVTKTLIERGADIYHRDANGDTAIIHAMENGNLEQVKALVDCLERDYRSQDHEKRCNASSTHSDSIAKAVEMENFDIIEVFCAKEDKERMKSAKNEVFVYAVGLEKEKVVQYSLKNAFTESIRDALHISCCDESDVIFKHVWSFVKDNNKDLRLSFLGGCMNIDKINPKIYEMMLKESLIDCVNKRSDHEVFLQNLEKKIESSRSNPLILEISKKYHDLIANEKKSFSEIGLKYLASDKDLTKGKSDFESKLTNDLEFVCPISQDLIVDPVTIGSSSQIYEKEKITKWLISKKTDPITREKLEITDDNKVLRDRKKEYEAQIRPFVDDVFNLYRNFVESIKSKNLDVENFVTGNELGGLRHYLNDEQKKFVGSIKDNFDQKFIDKLQENIPPNNSPSNQRASSLMILSGKTKALVGLA